MLLAADVLRGTVLGLLAATCIACADVAPSAPNVSEQTSPIVGGTSAQSGQWPDAVAVIGTSGYCTGTLIAPDVVLTAGHCAKLSPFQVIADTLDFSVSSKGIRAAVATTVAHPDWQTSYDVAAVILSSPISGVAPRKIGTTCTFDGFARNTQVHLVGFGATNSRGNQTNTQLKQAVTLVTDPDCTGGDGCKQAIAPGGEFVAGGSGQADSCFGDSGGPVYLDTPGGPVVIGSVSRGVSGSTTPCGGGIYVRTDKIADWVAQVTGKEIAADACDGVPYNTDDGDDAPADDNSLIGCSATGHDGGPAFVLAMIALCSRRRRHR